MTGLVLQTIIKETNKFMNTIGFQVPRGILPVVQFIVISENMLILEQNKTMFYKNITFLKSL